MQNTWFQLGETDDSNEIAILVADRRFSRMRRGGMGKGLLVTRKAGVL